MSRVVKRGKAQVLSYGKRAVPMSEMVISMPADADEAVGDVEQCAEADEVHEEETRQCAEEEEQRAKKHNKRSTKYQMSGALRYMPWVKKYVEEELTGEVEEEEQSLVDNYEVENHPCEREEDLESLGGVLLQKRTIREGKPRAKAYRKTGRHGTAISSAVLLPTMMGEREVLDEGYDEYTVVDENEVLKEEVQSYEAIKGRAKNLGTASRSDWRTKLYRAAIRGDWGIAENLLQQKSNLASAQLTEAGDMALHVAVSMKHTEFVRNLIRFVQADELMSYDGHGNTACHYAAMAGTVDIVRIMIEANSSLLHRENKYGTTPFELAISYGNARVVEYFLSLNTENVIEDSNEKELFDLLLAAITIKSFDVALIILNKNKNLALMRRSDDNRTALHVLAQLDISSGDCIKSSGIRLSCKLWTDMKLLLGRDEVAGPTKDPPLLNDAAKVGNLDLINMMKDPPLLHDAAKVGNLYLINMITDDYPDLLSHIDKDGYSLFHILVMHRNECILQILNQARNVKNFNAVSQDRDGNNFLHSAAKSIRPKGLEIVGEQDVQMQKAFAWFKAVEAVAPPIYKEMRNKDGYTPAKLFWKEHEELLSTSQAYMKSTAESCMLISTIVLSLVFAAAFAPPGGLDQDMGIPTLLTKKGFASFIIFQVLALFFSPLSIIGFWSIISSNYEQRQFFVLSHYLRLSMCALLLSVLFVISAFLSAFFLVFVQERKALVLSFMLPLYLVLVVGISNQLFKVLRKICKIIPGEGASSGEYTSLWGRVYYIRASIISFLSSCFRK